MFEFVPARLRTGVVADVTELWLQMLSSSRESCLQITRYQNTTHLLATIDCAPFTEKKWSAVDLFCTRKHVHRDQKRRSE